MSSDSDDDPTPQPYYGTRFGRPRTNASVPVSQFDSTPDRMSLGMTERSGQPTVWDAVNYPSEEEFEFDSYYIRYVRQAEARAIIDKPVNDTWQSAPITHDKANPDTDEHQTQFEKAVAEFMSGEHTRRKPLHRFNVLDRLARLGEYSILVLGFSDGRDLSTPVGGVEDGTDPEFNGLDDLMYIATFAQDRIISMTTETDMTSERFRLPLTFEVITEDPSEDPEEVSNSDYESQKIHWTRVIHVPEGTLEDDLRGTPALKPVFHELLNIDKIKAASAEGYWRSGYQGFVVSPPRDENGQLMAFEDGGDGVAEEIRKFLNNFEREISTTGNITSLDSDISDPTPHLEANYQSIAAAEDIPKSILTGEEMANTGNAENVRQWHQKIGQRRNNHADTVIYTPTIQRLIDVGVFPEPEGDGFENEWLPLDEMSEREEVELQKLMSEALSNMSPGGDPTHLASVPELRKALGWHPEIGMEVSPEYRESEESPSDAQTELALQVDEDQQAQLESGVDETPRRYRFSSPALAEDAADDLGISGYHVRRKDGNVLYIPGETHEAFMAALDDDESSNQPPEPTADIPGV